MEFQKEVQSILIIDDDIDDYELVREAFQQINPGIAVYYVKSCEDAISYRHQSFDLVLLDINMPQLDGFSWLKKIRDHGYTNLPVIMYTNSLSPTHIAKAYEEGANLYFTKPETFSALIKSLQALIRMDWSNPFSVTEKYRNQGHYKTFRLE